MRYGLRTIFTLAILVNTTIGHSKTPDADIIAVLITAESESFATARAGESEGELTPTELDSLAALDEGKSLEASVADEYVPLPNRTQLKITGFVDLGWIYPNFLADEPANLDHHYVESGNAQFTLNKIEARTFSVNEANFDFNITYSDTITAKASVFIYPTTRTNILPEFSPLIRDQDIPRDAGPDGEFGTDDDIIGKDTAVDFGDGRNRVVVGMKQAYIDFAYPGNLNAFLRIGKMPSLLGIEQEVLDAPRLATVSPSAIGVFSYGYPQGLQLRGAVLDGELEFGVGFTHDPNNFANVYPGDVTKNQPFALSNDNFALAGRLAFSHGARHRFTLGLSGQFGEKGPAGSVTDGSFSSFHPFVKLRLDPFDTPQIGPFRIRAEGLVMKIENRRGTHPNLSSRAIEKYDFLYTPKNDFDLGKDDQDADDVEHLGFYTYLSIDVLRKLTVTIGYSFFDSDVIGSKNPELFTPEGRFLEWGARRTQVALRYRIHDDVVVKTEFQKNKEKGNEKVIDNDVLTTSLVYSF